MSIDTIYPFSKLLLIIKTPYRKFVEYFTVVVGTICGTEKSFLRNVRI